MRNTKIWIPIITAAALCCGHQVKAEANLTVRTPAQTVCKIGDKLIRETPFSYKLDLQGHSDKFSNLHTIDFGRTFGLGYGGVAYAYTNMYFERDTVMTVEIDHNDACKVWCNGKQVYQKRGMRNLDVVKDERSIKMPFSFELPLQAGNNDIIIKSETSGKGKWCVLIQPPSENDKVYKVNPQYPSMGLDRVKNIDSKVARISNWLVIGPFAPGIDNAYQPETEFVFGHMYQGLDGAVTWTIPKIEVLGQMIDPAPWGTTYQWNYHNGGVAWAMAQLSELTGDDRYHSWAVNFCDYQMEGIPFVDYQVNKLNAYFNSANSLVIGSTLLDFTLAPSLPIIYRLRNEKDFRNREVYEKFIANMIEYARNGQIRTEGMSNYTRTTPEEYTVWVDDMFMGIPFLIQAGLYASDPKERDSFFDDAARQVVDFNKHVWDKDAKLYMHANYTSRPQVKLPHWSRANGWAIWAMSDVLMNLPKTHRLYSAILKQYKCHVGSLAKYQNEQGFWHNVIDRSDSPAEVSGTAIFTMAIARGIRLGWLDKKTYLPVVKKGWEAVASKVDDDGTVHDICVGTMCSEDVEYYVNRPFWDDDTHGSFAVIFAGIEVQNLFDKLGIDNSLAIK